MYLQSSGEILQWKAKQQELYEEMGFKIAIEELQPVFTRFHQQKYEMTYMRESTPNDKLVAFYGRHPNLHRIKVHDFRHTHASLLFETGASLKDVQARLGHSDIKTTMDIYTHVTQTAREKLADQFKITLIFNQGVLTGYYFCYQRKKAPLR